MSIRNTKDSRLLDNTASLDGTIRRESITPGTIASDILTVDYWSNSIYSVSSPSANFTVNLVNAPTENDKIINLNIVVTQGATARIPSAFQIGGAAQTLRWVANITPTGTSNKIDIFSFSIIRQSSAWVVLGQASLNF